MRRRSHVVGGRGVQRGDVGQLLVRQERLEAGQGALLAREADLRAHVCRGRRRDARAVQDESGHGHHAGAALVHASAAHPGGGRLRGRRGRGRVRRPVHELRPAACQARRRAGRHPPKGCREGQQRRVARPHPADSGRGGAPLHPDHAGGGACPGARRGRLRGRRQRRRRGAGRGLHGAAGCLRGRTLEDRHAQAGRAQDGAHRTG
mmetsp:Transcript_46455/g.111267  ORF Transcript_46455/g.111267 Transcript_46455/m.111267 type:complete len:206 (-) Transcript_46455:297-914(-)